MGFYMEVLILGVVLLQDWKGWNEDASEYSYYTTTL